MTPLVISHLQRMDDRPGSRSRSALRRTGLGYLGDAHVELVTLLGIERERFDRPDAVDGFDQLGCRALTSDCTAVPTLRRTVGSIATRHRQISRQIARTTDVMIVLTMNMIGRKTRGRMSRAEFRTTGR